MRRSILLLPLVLLFSLATGQTKKPSASGTLDIRQIMTAAEFNRAGLQKLTPEEVDALNEWLYQYSLRLLVNTAEPIAPTGNAIESYIEGEFEGRDGETVFKLDNGQIWQQALYAYTYHYSYTGTPGVIKDQPTRIYAITAPRHAALSVDCLAPSA
jgi:hypothetical protein